MINTDNKEKNKVLVETYNGEIHDKSKCRKFNEGYYLIGKVDLKDSGQCYKINNKYYRIDTELVIWDYELQKYNLKGQDLIYGVIDFSENNEIYGFFTENPIKNIKFKDKFGKLLNCISEDVISKNKEYREDISTGLFLNKKYQRSIKFNTINNIDNDYKYKLDYTCDKVLPNALELYNKYFEFKDNIPVFKQISNDLKELSFGLEFETVRGFIPKRYHLKNGLIPLRDGSIGGLEYVTVPLQGLKGIHSLYESLKVLKERTIYDKSCSLHLHIGNIPRTKEFILAFFKVICILQDEFFEMFPLYKKYNFGVKNKNYTSPYSIIKTYGKLDSVIDGQTSIDKNFNTLFTFLSGGYSLYDFGKDLDDIINHPKNPRGEHKWNVKTRYYFVNFIALLFGNKKTIEFRIHTPTYDADKILSYLLLCGAIVNYVKFNQYDILRDSTKYSNITLHHIISNQLSENLYYRLSYYINDRKKYTEDFNREGNINYDEDTIIINPNSKLLKNI